MDIYYDKWSTACCILKYLLIARDAILCGADLIGFMPCVFYAEYAEYIYRHRCSKINNDRFLEPDTIKQSIEAC